MEKYVLVIDKCSSGEKRLKHNLQYVREALNGVPVRMEGVSRKTDMLGMRGFETLLMGEQERFPDLVVVGSQGEYATDAVYAAILGAEDRASRAPIVFLHHSPDHHLSKETQLRTAIISSGNGYLCSNDIQELRKHFQSAF